MQLDGEPWMQHPSTIEIKLGGQVTVLKAPPNPPEEPGDEAMNKEL